MTKKGDQEAIHHSRSTGEVFGKQVNKVSVYDLHQIGWNCYSFHPTLLFMFCAALVLTKTVATPSYPFVHLMD